MVNGDAPTNKVMVSAINVMTPDQYKHVVAMYEGQNSIWNEVNLNGPRREVKPFELIDCLKKVYGDYAATHQKLPVEHGSTNKTGSKNPFPPRCEAHHPFFGKCVECNALSRQHGKGGKGGGKKGNTRAQGPPNPQKNANCKANQCFECSGEGHWASQCPSKNAGNGKSKGKGKAKQAKSKGDQLPNFSANQPAAG